MSILGIDYGLKRVGLAISIYGQKAHPLKVVQRKNFDKELENLLKSENIETIVIGLPEGRFKKTVESFGRKLKKKTSLVIEFIDESLSSYNAKEELLNFGLKRKKKERVA